MLTIFRYLRLSFCLRDALLRTSLAIILAVCATTAQPQIRSSTTQIGSGSTIGFATSDICIPDLIEAPMVLRQSGADADQPVQLEADVIEGADEEQVELSGNAHIVRGSRGLFADHVLFSQSTYEALASGNVRFYNGNGDEIKADELTLEVDTFIGSARNVDVRFVGANQRSEEREHRRFTETYSLLAPFLSRIPEATEDKEAEEEDEAAGESDEAEADDGLEEGTEAASDEVSAVAEPEEGADAGAEEALADMVADMAAAEEGTDEALTDEAEAEEGTEEALTDAAEAEEAEEGADSWAEEALADMVADMAAAEAEEALTDGTEAEEGAEEALTDATEEEEEAQEPVARGPVYAGTRAHAVEMEFEGKDHQVLYDATLSTCVEGDDSVLLMAKRMELDHATGIGSAKNITLRFKKVPIFYLPQATFPINNERKTGFLFPRVGYESRNGLSLSIPYYFNIAPQHDATLRPTVFENRGVQVYGEYRYLTRNSSGEVRAEFLPSDELCGEFNDFCGEDRYAVNYQHRYEFGANNRWKADIDLQDVSDRDYTGDFSSNTGISASGAFVEQRANLSYSNDILSLSGRLSTYTRANDEETGTSQPPYERLPQVTVDFRERDIGPLAYGADTQYTKFSAETPSDANTTPRVEGARLQLLPYIDLPFEKTYGYLKPRASLRMTQYSGLENFTIDGEPAEDDSPSATVPIFSIGGGLFFERTFEFRNKGYLQTLEPQLLYLHIPERDQNDLPSFDGSSSGSVSSFQQTFREPGVGGDRLDEADQLALGITSRFEDNDSGAEKFKISIGQVYDFIEGTTRGNTVADASTKVSEDWSVGGSATYSNEENELTRLSFNANYSHSARRSGAISYSRGADDDGQLNLRLEAPLTPQWQMAARFNYSLEASEARDSELILSYDGCCWATGLRIERDHVSTGDYTHRFTLTFELDALGRISSKLL